MSTEIKETQEQERNANVTNLNVNAETHDIIKDLDLNRSEISIDGLSVIIGEHNDFREVMRFLSEEDKQALLNRTSIIDPKNVSSVIGFGSDSVSKLSKAANSVLERADSGRDDTVKGYVLDVMKQFDMFDGGNEKSKLKQMVKSIPFIGERIVKNSDVMRAQAKSASQNIDTMSDSIKKVSLDLMSDNNIYGNMFEDNKRIIAQSKIDAMSLLVRIEIEKATLEELKQDPNTPESELIRQSNFIHALEMRTANLITSIVNSEQMQVAITTSEATNMRLIDTCVSLVENEIPQWKNQLSLMIGAKKTESVVAMTQEFADRTNALILETADVVKENAIKTAKANQETIIRPETLERVRKKWTELGDELKRIQEADAGNIQNILNCVNNINKAVENNTKRVRTSHKSATNDSSN